MAMVAGKRMQQEEVRPSSITPRAGVETRNASASKGKGRLIYFSACVQVLRLKAMTEAAHAATGAANRHDFIPVLRLLDLGRTARKLAALAKERHQFGQSLVDDYKRRRRHPTSSASEPETRRTVIGDLLREQERSPESLDDVVIRTVCLVSRRHANDLQASFWPLMRYRRHMDAWTAPPPARNVADVSRTGLASIN